MSFNKNALYFLGYVVDDCIHNGIKVRFELKKSVYRGSAAGYFLASHPTYELVVATRQEDWLWVLVHEWAHFQQCQSNSEIWERGEEAIQVLSEFWNEKEEIADYIFDDLALLEADCDRIALETIRKFKLPIPIRKYIQASNINTAIYLYFKKSRCRGGVKKGVCSESEVMKSTPSKKLYPDVDLGATVLAIDKFNKRKNGKHTKI